jgi:hypothetical protein
MSSIREESILMFSRTDYGGLIGGGVGSARSPGRTYSEERDQEIVELSVFQAALPGLCKRGSDRICNDLEIASQYRKCTSHRSSAESREGDGGGLSYNVIGILL